MSDPSGALSQLSEPASLRQLRVIVPALAGTALAVVGAVGLNRLWDLNYAPWWGVGAVAAGLIGLAIAAVLIAYAYAGSDKAPSVGGLTAQQVLDITSGRGPFSEDPLKLHDASDHLKNLVTVQEKPMTVNLEKIDEAEGVLNKRIMGFNREGLNKAETSGLTYIQSLPGAWKISVDLAQAGAWREEASRHARLAIGGAVSAIVLFLPLSIWLALSGSYQDATEEAAAIRNREKEKEAATVTREIEKETRAKADKSDGDSIAITRPANVTVWITDADDIEIYRILRGECEYGTDPAEGIPAVATGGTWERPRLTIEKNANEGSSSCRAIYFEPQSRPAMKPR